MDFSICEMDPSIWNGPPHLAKWTPPFQMDHSISQKGGVHFTRWRGQFQKLGGPFSKMEGSFCGKRRSPFRNGPLHLAKRTPASKMDPSICQTEGSVCRNGGSILKSGNEDQTEKMLDLLSRSPFSLTVWVYGTPTVCYEHVKASLKSLKSRIIWIMTIQHKQW